MRKELEALKYLKENKRRHWLDGDQSQECLDIIEASLNKYEQYKTIEEELGIDLLTLLKALKQECIYIKNIYNEVVKHHFMIEERFGKYLIYDKEWLIELKDYGKTWALTREELL